MFECAFGRNDKCVVIFENDCGKEKRLVMFECAFGRTKTFSNVRILSWKNKNVW